MTTLSPASSLDPLSACDVPPPRSALSSLESLLVHAARAMTERPATMVVPIFERMGRRDFIVLLLGAEGWCRDGEVRRRRQVLLFRDANRCWSRTAATMMAPLRSSCSEME